MSIVVCQEQDQITTKNPKNMAGLRILQSLSDITTIVRKRDELTYVHPTEKRSVSKLNEKSLEMCTESLGTETGSESGDELSLLVFEAPATTPRVYLKPEDDDITNLRSKKSTMSRNNSFPPPIKFFEDSTCNRMVRWLGEDGRLVVQSIRVSSAPRCFVAERGEGRLRLCLSLESSQLRVEEEEGEEETEKCIDEENNENLEGKNGNKKLGRLSSRCKENGREPKPMLTWKQQQFWVATELWLTLLFN